MLWMVGYLVAGIVAVVVTVVYSMVIVPYVCGYETEDWMDFFLEYLENDQSKLDNCIGASLTMFLWPLKIVWFLCDIVPAMLDAYDARLENV